MVLIKHNFLKSDIFFNPMFVPGFSGAGSRGRVQVLEISKTWTRTLDPDPGLGPWTLDPDPENLGPEKLGP